MSTDAEKRIAVIQLESKRLGPATGDFFLFGGARVTLVSPGQVVKGYDGMSVGIFQRSGKLRPNGLSAIDLPEHPFFLGGRNTLVLPHLQGELAQELDQPNLLTRQAISQLYAELSSGAHLVKLPKPGPNLLGA